MRIAKLHAIDDTSPAMKLEWGGAKSRPELRSRERKVWKGQGCYFLQEKLLRLSGGNVGTRCGVN